MKINGEDLSNIKKNVNEIGYYNSLTKIFKKIFIIIITIFIVFILSEVFFIYKIKSDYNLNQNILNNGQKYEKSIYIKYEGKIYCNSFGDIYQLKDVDIDSFKTFDTGDYRDNYIATDKNNVYLGNNIIPDLNPNRLKSLGSNYYSDGVNYYFLSDIYIKNEDTSAGSLIKEYIIKNKKKQLYSYPFKKIETTKALKGIENFRYLASDGEKVYYKGELIENADLYTLKAVDKYNDDYFYDKNNVYYKTKALNLSSNDNLNLVSVEQGERTYLYDGLNGNVSLEEYIFDKKYIPYQILGIGSAHVKDLLFVSKDGIFFYNPETKEQERAGDNIFKGKVENILSSVISDDKNFYYLHSYDIYRKKRTKHGYIDILVSKNIGIFSLGEKKDWEKIKDIDSGTTGEVWKKGNKYYYFDDLGVYQLIDDVVYEIVDNASLKYLLETNNTQIIQEKLEFILTKKRGIYFDISENKSSINEKIFLDKNTYTEIKTSCLKFWGKHSFLSILFHEVNDKSDKFIRDQISDNFDDFLKFISRISCKIKFGSRQERGIIGLPKEILGEYESGSIPVSDEDILDKTEKMLTDFFTLTNRDIKKAFYKKNIADEEINYSLILSKKIAGKIRDIDFSLESTGTQSIIQQLPFMLVAVKGSVAIIDEFDTGIHDLLVKSLITSLNNDINGQLILTTHNTLLMESDIPKDSIYVINELSSNDKEIQCILHYNNKISDKNNVRNQYLLGKYSGIPENNLIDFHALLDEIK